MNKKIISLVIIMIAVVAIVSTVIVTSNPAKRFQKAMEAGKKFLTSDEWENAIAQFEKAISIDPYSPDAYEEAVSAYIKGAEFKISIPDYKAAKEYYEKADEYAGKVLNIINTGEYEKAKIPASKSTSEYQSVLSELMDKIKTGLDSLPADTVTDNDNTETAGDTSSSSNPSDSNSGNSSNSDNNANSSGTSGNTEVNTLEEFAEATRLKVFEQGGPYVVSYTLYRQWYGESIAIYEANISKFENNVSGEDAITLCKVYRSMWNMYANTNQLETAKGLYDKWLKLSSECGNPNEWNPGATIDEYGRVISIAGSTCSYTALDNRPTTLTHDDGTINHLKFDSEGRVIWSDSQHNEEVFEYSGNTATVQNTQENGEVYMSVYTINEATGEVTIENK